MTTLSTHVLDVGEGRPGANVLVTLDRFSDGGWVAVNQATTDADGRISDLGIDLAADTYRISFLTGQYGNTLFPQVDVVVNISEDQNHYHVPLLLSPYGYTTYRGS
jgi:5-hydroxyisourate hydrolase